MDEETELSPWLESGSYSIILSCKYCGTKNRYHEKDILRYYHLHYLEVVDDLCTNNWRSTMLTICPGCKKSFKSSDCPEPIPGIVKDRVSVDRVVIICKCQHVLYLHKSKITGEDSWFPWFKKAGCCLCPGKMATIKCEMCSNKTSVPLSAFPDHISREIYYPNERLSKLV